MDPEVTFKSSFDSTNKKNRNSCSILFPFDSKGDFFSLFKKLIGFISVNIELGSCSICHFHSRYLRCISLNVCFHFHITYHRQYIEHQTVCWKIYNVRCLSGRDSYFEIDFVFLNQITLFQFLFLIKRIFHHLPAPPTMTKSNKLVTW